MAYETEVLDKLWTGSRLSKRGLEGARQRCDTYGASAGTSGMPLRGRRGSGIV